MDNNQMYKAIDMLYSKPDEYDQNTKIPFSQHDIEFVNFFYDSLMDIYDTAQWTSLFPNKIALNKSKNVYKNHIVKLSKSQVIAGCSYIRSKNKDINTDYQLPDIDTAIGCCRRISQNTWKKISTDYKPFNKAKFIAKGRREDNKKAHDEFMKGYVKN